MLRIQRNLWGNTITFKHKILLVLIMNKLIVGFWGKTKISLIKQSTLFEDHHRAHGGLGNTAHGGQRWAAPSHPPTGVG